MLQITNLHATVGDKPIFKGLTFALTLLIATPVLAQSAPMMSPPSGGLMINDLYIACFMEGAGRAYPDGPTGSLTSRENTLKSIKASCENIKMEVDTKAMADAANVGASQAEMLGPVNHMRREMENHIRTVLGLPIAK